MSVIHICFGLHDATGEYSKYTATAIASVLMNTTSEVIVHVLHDETLTDVNRNRLNETVNRFSGRIKYYRVNIDERQYDGYDLARFTIGALFRLMICNELKEETSRVIYLDSDLVVNLDIVELWNEDLGDCLMGGCVLNVPGSWPLIDKGIVDRTEFFNSGVLLMDIAAINREHDLWKECNSFLLERPDLWRALDQDAINYVFRGEIKKLDGKYNSRSSECRQLGISDKRIYHFAGDCPRDVFCYAPDRYFFDAFRMTPWGMEEKIVDHYQKRIMEKDYQKQTVLELMKQIYEHPEKKKVFWGIGGAIHGEIMDQIPWNEGDYFVDSKESLWNQPHRGGVVFPPKQLLEEDPNETIVIVTIFRYKEVKPVLEEYGFTENTNFFNGKCLLPETATLFCSGERDNKWDL